MTRIEMMNDVIGKFGMENANTIKFCRNCENLGDSWLDTLAIEADYTALMEDDIFLAD